MRYTILPRPNRDPGIKEIRLVELRKRPVERTLRRLVDEGLNKNKSLPQLTRKQPWKAPIHRPA